MADWSVDAACEAKQRLRPILIDLTPHGVHAVGVRCACTPNAVLDCGQGPTESTPVSSTDPVISVQVRPGSDLDALRKKISPHVDPLIDGRRMRVRFEVREVEVPELHAGCQPPGKERQRPVPGGFSIGQASSGTLGGWVWDLDESRVVLLSNAHVIGAPGATVYQPGGEGVVTDNVIAQVVRSTPTPDQGIAVPIADDVVDETIECLGPAVRATDEAACCMPVQKMGATTGLTVGTVTELCYESFVLDAGSGSDIKVEPPYGGVWTQSGDSGSLYCVRDSDPPRVVGLHWGGVQGGDCPYGLAIPIQTVFEALRVDVLPHAVP